MAFTKRSAFFDIAIFNFIGLIGVFLFTQPGLCDYGFGLPGYNPSDLFDNWALHKYWEDGQPMAASISCQVTEKSPYTHDVLHALAYVSSGEVCQMWNILSGKRCNTFATYNTGAVAMCYPFPAIQKGFTKDLMRLHMHIDIKGMTTKKAPMPKWFFRKEYPRAVIKNPAMAQILGANLECELFVEKLVELAMSCAHGDDDPHPGRTQGVTVYHKNRPGTGGLIPSVTIVIGHAEDASKGFVLPKPSFINHLLKSWGLPAFEMFADKY